MAFCKLTKEQKGVLESLFNEFDMARDHLHSELNEIVNEWTEEMDEKSDRYKESEAGQQAQERIEAIEQMRDNFEECPEFDLNEV